MIRPPTPSRMRGGVALLLSLVLAASPGLGAAAQDVEAPPSADVDATAPAVTAPPVSAAEPPSYATDSNNPLFEGVPGPPTDGPGITAAGAVVWDPADGVVLFGKDEGTSRRMASLTKVMTVLLALEALEAGGVPDTLVVSEAAAAEGRITGGATLGLEAGQEVAVRDVLAGLLLRSGNDGAVAIAEHVAGSEPAFVALMNARAIELGLSDTMFVNASGLTDDPAHHATPLDMALLGSVAMQHPDFAAWAGAAQLQVDAFGLLENRNELLQRYEGATGIKTGFTNLAGLCLVASAERDGRTLYAVVLGSDDRVADTAALFDHGFEAFERVEPVAAGDPLGSYRFSAGEVELVPSQPLARTIAAGGAVSTVLRLAPDAALPVAPGTPLGEAVLLVDGVEVERTAAVTVGQLAPDPDADDAGAAVADALRAFGRLLPREPAGLDEAA